MGVDAFCVRDEVDVDFEQAPESEQEDDPLVDSFWQLVALLHPELPLQHDVDSFF